MSDNRTPAERALSFALIVAEILAADDPDRYDMADTRAQAWNLRRGMASAIAGDPSPESVGMMCPQAFADGWHIANMGLTVERDDAVCPECGDDKPRDHTNDGVPVCENCCEGCRSDRDGPLTAREQHAPNMDRNR